MFNTALSYVGTVGMPITKDRFQGLDEDSPRPETNAEIILGFLVENDGYAFTMSEIAEETEIPRGSVGPTLKRLEDDGAVEHRANYWRVSDTHLASRSSVSHTATTAADYDDGEEFDVSEWAEHAEDDRAARYADGAEE